jgi:hypothetical protein
MRLTVIYIAIRWLRKDCRRFHIIMLYKPVYSEYKNVTYNNTNRNYSGEPSGTF